MVTVINEDTSIQVEEMFFTLINRMIDVGENGSVAFDVEGVNLSRAGTVELVSLAFSSGVAGEESVFLVDFGGKRKAEQIAAVKRLFEADVVEKIIHDCRMDCDALVHLYSINLQNVHDTSIYHELITGVADSNLNDVLSSNGVGVNNARDKSVYRSNPKFWSTRPLTVSMIEWAASDVDKLLATAERQKRMISGSKAVTARRLSLVNATQVSSMSLIKGMRLSGGKRPGSFIGKRGSNIRALQKRTGTMIYQDHDGSTNAWMVFYPTDSALATVKHAMGHD